MNVHIENAARYITKKVHYDPESHEYKGMKIAVGRLLEILVLNAGIMVSTYFISISLSILSLVMTGASAYVIYSIIKKIYRDLRVDAEAGVTAETADSEFNRIIGLVSSAGWDYTMIGFTHLQMIRR